MRSAQKIVLCVAMFTVGAAAPAAAASEEIVELTTEQQRMLLEEAGEFYRQAPHRSGPQGDAAAKEQFAEAAERYQTVVDSGVRNSDLYFYLGNASLQSGQLGRAIANYRRALRLRPADQRYLRNLRFAQQAAAAKATSQAGGAGAPGQTTWSREPLTAAAAWLERWISIQQARWIAVAGWLLLWSAVAVRLYRREAFAGKSLATLGLAVTVAAMLFVGTRYGERTRSDVAVVVAEAVVVRTGDGQSFPAAAEVAGAEGTLVEVLDRRPGWYRIRANSDVAGWVQEDVLEVIAPDSLARRSAAQAATL